MRTRTVKKGNVRFGEIKAGGTFAAVGNEHALFIKTMEEVYEISKETGKYVKRNSTSLVTGKSTRFSDNDFVIPIEAEVVVYKD